MHLNTYGLKPIDFNTISPDQKAGLGFSYKLVKKVSTVNMLVFL